MKSVQTNHRFSLQELLEFFRPHSFKSTDKLTERFGLPQATNLLPVRTNLVKRLSEPKIGGKRERTVKYIKKGSYASVETLSAMHKGEDIIVGGLLQSKQCEANPPFLVKKHGVHSSVGSFHYEVWACLDNPPTDPLILIELCAAAEALADNIGAMPKFVHIAVFNGQVLDFDTDTLTAIYAEIKAMYFQSSPDGHGRAMRPISNLAAFRSRKAQCGTF